MVCSNNCPIILGHVEIFGVCSSNHSNRHVQLSRKSVDENAHDYPYRLKYFRHRRNSQFIEQMEFK